MKSLFAALACVLALARAAAAADALVQLEQFASGVQTLRAKFEQTLYDESGARLERSRGTMYLERPGRFRFDYTEPYRQVIVSDGERVWMYDAELEQVTVRLLDRAVGVTPAALLSAEKPLDATLIPETLGERAGLAWVELRPRAEDASFARVRLGLEGAVPRRMELEDNFGQVTELRFFDVVKNPPLDPERFRFTPPPGADVVGDVPEGGASGAPR